MAADMNGRNPVKDLQVIGNFLLKRQKESSKNVRNSVVVTQYIESIVCFLVVLFAMIQFTSLICT